MNYRKGQALVEAALVFVAFFAIIIGLLEVGQMLFLHQTLTQRAQAAVRWGATNRYDPVSITNLVLYGNTSPGPDDRPFGGLSASNVAVSNPGCGPNPNVDCRVTVVISGHSGQTIQVSLPSEVQ